MGHLAEAPATPAADKRDHDDGGGQSLVGGGLCRATHARFAVAAAEEGTAFIPFVGELDNILCIEEERVAGLDNTVRYEGRRLQIPPNRNRHHFAKSTIRVLEYWNGAIALFHGPREIARFHADGTLNEKTKAKKEFAA